MKVRKYFRVKKRGEREFESRPFFVQSKIESGRWLIVSQGYDNFKDAVTDMNRIIAVESTLFQIHLVAHDV